MAAPLGTWHTGLRESTMLRGSMVPLAQLEKSYRFMGTHGGSSTISGGSAGTAFQLHCPKRASHILVKTRVRGMPPLDRMNSRALVIRGSSGEAPASFRAK